MRIRLENELFGISTVPERSWAAKTWSQRATVWLHTEPHDLELEDGGKVIVYHVNGYENGFKIVGRSLSQMNGGCVVPGIDAAFEQHRRNCIREATAALERL